MCVRSCTYGHHVLPVQEDDIDTDAVDESDTVAVGVVDADHDEEGVADKEGVTLGVGALVVLADGDTDVEDVAVTEAETLLVPDNDVDDVAETDGVTLTVELAQH